MTFEQYIEKNYKTLIDIASRVFCRSQIQSEEIVHEMYLDIVTNKREIRPSEKDYEYYCRRWIKSRLKWTGGNVINEIKIDDRITEDIERHKYRLYTEPQEPKSIIRVDLENVGFSPEQSFKIESCVQIAKSFPLYHKRLFELYYLDGMSIGKIARSCELPKTTIYREILKIQEQIKSEL